MTSLEREGAAGVTVEAVAEKAAKDFPGVLATARRREPS
jgi:hypothetical protein